MALSSLTYEVPRARRWNTFVAGLAINLIGVLLPVALGSRLGTQVLVQPAASYHVTLIAPSIEPAPRPVPERIIPPPPPQQIAELETRPLAPPTSPVRREPPPPKVEPPKQALQRPEPPKPELPKSGAFTLSAAAPVAAKQSQEVEVVKTNVFEAPKSAIASVHQPAREVQTGGFGDPNGIRGQGDPKKQPLIVASVCSFDLPSGPGKGNGTGGTHGVSGTIRSTGFGDGVASSVPRARNAGSVMPSGFGDAVVKSGQSAPQRIEKKPDLQPVEIVFKPRPQYTPEARQLRLEGRSIARGGVHRFGLVAHQPRGERAGAWSGRFRSGRRAAHTISPGAP